LNHNPLNLHLPGIWDYRCIPLCLAHHFKLHVPSLSSKTRNDLAFCSAPGMEPGSLHSLHLKGGLLVTKSRCLCQKDLELTLFRLMLMTSECYSNGMTGPYQAPGQRGSELKECVHAPPCLSGTNTPKGHLLCKGLHPSLVGTVLSFAFQMISTLICPESLVCDNVENLVTPS
jgi:hypothetical protein